MVDEKKIIPPIKQVNPELYEAIAPFVAAWIQIQPAVKEAYKTLSSNIAQIAYSVKKSIDELPDKYKKMLNNLAQLGWFISLETPMDDLLSMNVSFSDRNYKEVDSCMSELINSEMEIIKKDLVKNFPHRSKILKSAFSAHKKKMYNLSIPAFFAQADGICLELLGVKLFQKKNGKPLTAKEINKYSFEKFTSALLEPLRIVHPMSTSEKSNLENKNVLNRHEILHGISLDYGSEINSLKTISLLNYLNSILFNSVKNELT